VVLKQVLQELMLVKTVVLQMTLLKTRSLKK
jgi:hypothetical protein